MIPIATILALKYIHVQRQSIYIFSKAHGSLPEKDARLAMLH